MARVEQSAASERSYVRLNGVPSISTGIIRNATIEGNVIRDNGGGSAFAAGGGAGINLDGVQGSKVRNNLLVNNHASGIALFRINGGGGSSDPWSTPPASSDEPPF